jgi:hypothetical protein
MKAPWSQDWKLAQPVERTAFVLIAIASFLNVLLALLNYPVIGHDAYVHLNWLDQFARLTSEGIFYPRWLPDSFGGFGAPTFYFQSPLVYWCASCFHALGLISPSHLYQATQLLFSFLSVFTSFFLFRQHGSTRLRALAGALLYSFLAYRFCDVYVRNAFTEHAALAFLPLVFLRFPDRIQSITISAIGWTGLLLTNLPIAYIRIVSGIILILARRTFSVIPTQIAAFTIALAASALYLFPVFALRGLVHPEHLFNLPMNTSQYGFALLDLFQDHFDWLRVLTVTTIMGGAVCFISLIGNPDREYRPWKWLIAIAVLLQIPFLALPFWNLIPGMTFVQFSWRWNGVLLLIIALNAGTHAKTFPSIFSIFIGLALITILSELTLSRNLFIRPPLPINSFRMDAPEYATKWASSDPSEVIAIAQRRLSDPPAILLGLTLSGDTVALTSKSPNEWKFSAKLDRAAPVRFHQFYWPYWKLYKDSIEIPLAPDPNGFATAELPAGYYPISLKLEKSEMENTGFITSLIGCSILIILLIVSSYRAITKPREITSPPTETRNI